jgi:pilus assembly protein Flp/PilA
MAQFVRLVKSFRRAEDGQDLLEYALLVALIALVAVGGVTLAGIRVNDIFAAIAAAIPLPS